MDFLENNPLNMSVFPELSLHTSLLPLYSFLLCDIS
jgi:hypothetical protein